MPAMLRVIVFAQIALLGCSTALAEVTALAPQGFESRHSAVVDLAPQAAYQRFIAIESWWAGSHTYSGDARRLSLDARAGGCWCERLDGGGVEHMRVVYVDSGKAIRFEGGLGPLQELGVRGVLTVTFHAEGEGSRVTMAYRVGGWRDTGFADLAPLVDAVLAEQFKSFAALAPS
jgi:uncharacterized protein YndB with AHSA1/START domain